MRTIPPELPQHAHFADGLLLSHIAHAAGVEQNDIGVCFICDELIAPLSEHFGHLIGVTLVHLAAVSFDVDAGHFGGGEFAVDGRYEQGQVYSRHAENPTFRLGLAAFFGAQLGMKISVEFLNGIGLPHPSRRAVGVVLVWGSILDGKVPAR
jgi:hypothetical protein